MLLLSIFFYSLRRFYWNFLTCLGKYASHGDETLLQFLYFYPKMDRNDTAMSYMFNSLWATIASGRLAHFYSYSS